MRRCGKGFDVVRWGLAVYCVGCWVFQVWWGAVGSGGVSWGRVGWDGAECGWRGCVVEFGVRCSGPGVGCAGMGVRGWGVGCCGGGEKG